MINITVSESVEQVNITVTEPDLSPLASKWVVAGDELVPADASKKVNAEYLTGTLVGGLFHP